VRELDPLLVQVDVLPGESKNLAKPTSRLGRGVEDQTMT
jgi:hypothetical protein